MSSTFSLENISDPNLQKYFDPSSASYLDPTSPTYLDPMKTTSVYLDYGTYETLNTKLGEIAKKYKWTLCDYLACGATCVCGLGTLLILFWDQEREFNKQRKIAEDRVFAEVAGTVGQSAEVIKRLYYRRLNFDQRGY